MDVARACKARKIEIGLFRLEEMRKIQTKREWLGHFYQFTQAKRAKFFDSKQPSKQLTDVFSGTKNEDELNQQQMKGDRETRWIGRERGREKGKCQAREIRTNANREKRNLHVNEETK